MTASSQQYCLRWNNHRLNLLTVFDELLQNSAFTDVTIMVDCGQSIKCHKIVLAACSSYFQNLFLTLPNLNGIYPIVVLKDVRYSEIKAILEYMYRGEVNVAQDQLSGLLKVAEVLKVKGLVNENAGNKGEEDSVHDFRREVLEGNVPMETSPPPAISTSTGSNVHSSGHVVSPPHSSTVTYNLCKNAESFMSLTSKWASMVPQRVSSPTLPGEFSTHSISTFSGSYDNYDSSPHKRMKKLMQPNLLSQEKQSILRKVLDVNLNHPDSSQTIPLLPPDSHELIYRDMCSNGPTNGSNRHGNIDLAQRETIHSPYDEDEDEKQPSPQPIEETKSGTIGISFVRKKKHVKRRNFK